MLQDMKTMVDSAWLHAEELRVLEKMSAKRHPGDELKQMRKEHLDRLTYHLGWASLFLREMIDENMKQNVENGGC